MAGIDQDAGNPCIILQDGTSGKISGSSQTVYADQVFRICQNAISCCISRGGVAAQGIQDADGAAPAQVVQVKPVTIQVIIRLNFIQHDIPGCDDNQPTRSILGKRTIKHLHCAGCLDFRSIIITIGNRHLLQFNTAGLVFHLDAVSGAAGYGNITEGQTSGIP